MYHGEVETSRQLELGLTVEMDSGEFKPKDYTFGYACSEQDDGQASLKPKVQHPQVPNCLALVHHIQLALL